MVRTDPSTATCPCRRSQHRSPFSLLLSLPWNTGAGHSDHFLAIFLQDVIETLFLWAADGALARSMTESVCTIR